MLSQKDSMTLNDQPFTTFSTSLTPRQQLWVNQKLERLKEKCPSQAAIKVRFEKRPASFIGEISIKSFSREFYSKKIAHDLFQVYLLLEADIEEQLLEWKRTRFIDKFAKNLQKSHLRSPII